MARDASSSGSRVETCVLLNPAAGKTDTSPVVKALREGSFGRCEEIPAPGEGGRAAERLIAEGVDRIIIAGGDGTVRDVANGVLRAERRVTLGVLPLGTGNDLARTLAIPLAPEEALEALREGEVRSLDVVQVTFGEERTHFLNVAAGGFGGAVEKGWAPHDDAVPGVISYLTGAVSRLPELEGRQTVLTWEDGSVEAVTTLAIVVANGRTAAGGMRVAPLADPEDGLMDVIVVRDASIVELATMGARLVSGRELEAEPVVRRRARGLSVASEPGMRFSLDGEPVREGPLEFRVVPGSLSFVVGPEYRRRPEERE